MQRVVSLWQMWQPSRWRTCLQVQKAQSTHEAAESKQKEALGLASALSHSYTAAHGDQKKEPVETCEASVELCAAKEAVTEHFRVLIPAACSPCG